MFDRVLNMPWILNMSLFWIYRDSEYTRFWTWICQCSKYTTVLNMPGLHRVLNMSEYFLGKSNYTWMCLNLSEWFCCIFNLCNPLPKGTIRLFFLKSKKIIFPIVTESTWFFAFSFFCFFGFRLNISIKFVVNIGNQGMGTVNLVLKIYLSVFVVGVVVFPLFGASRDLIRDSWFRLQFCNFVRL